MKEKNIRKSRGNRIKEVISILAKYGLITDWFKNTGLPVPTQLTDKGASPKFTKLPRSERMRLAIIELGTTYIKLGQILSTREDLIGEELAKEFKLLQQDVPADSKKDLLATFKSEFDAKPEDYFREFDYNALASASVGQVHMAKLKTGKKVVVKIQHANIEEKIKGDLLILEELAQLAQKYGTQNIKNLNPLGIYREFSQTLKKELDYRVELRNTNLFYQNFLYNEELRFPKTYKDSSGKRVLTLEYLDGVSLSDIGERPPRGFDGEALAQACTEMYLDMVFKYGVYHGDPHPGNIKIIKGKVLGILDCGMVGYVDNRLRGDFEVIISSLVEKDSVKLTKAVTEIGIYPGTVNEDALRDDLGNYINDYLYIPLEEFNLKEASQDLLSILKKHQISFPPAIISILKLLVMLEGTMRLLNPIFSVTNVLKSYTGKLMLSHFSPEGIIKKFHHSIVDWTKLIDSFPGEIRDIIIRLRKGVIQVNLNHQGLESTGKLLVLGILASSLIISSALLWTSKAPPLFNDISIFGGIGFITAFVLVLFIISKLLKSKKD